MTRPDPAQPGTRSDLLLALDLPMPAVQALLSESGHVISVAAADLDARCLATLMPATVAVPLWSQGPDAMQLLQRLCDLGYAGPVLVICPPLPNHRMVARELHGISPLLQITLIQMPE